MEIIPARILVNEEAGGETGIRAALQLAAEKWRGRVRLTGAEAFKLRAARIAVDLGITVINPELQPVIGNPRLERQEPQNHAAQAHANPEVSTMQAPAFHSPRANSSEELDAICRIDLVSYLEGRGYQIDQKESTRASIKLRGKDVLIVRRRDDGVYEYFTAGDSHDNGTIIQYVERRDGLNLGQARKALRSLIDQAFERERETSPPEHQRQVEIDHTEIRRRWMLADLPDGANRYLKDRGLDDETIRRYAADIRFDARGNALFAHRDAQGNITGYEIKGETFTGFASGGHKSVALFGEREHPSRIVVTESGIDALSLAQLERCPSDTLYVSTGGSLAQRALDAIQHLSEQHPDATLELGMDRDAAGEAMRQKIQVALKGRGVAREPALGQDWNDELKHQRGLDQGPAIPPPSPNRQQEIELPERKRQRDIDLPPF